MYPTLLENTTALLNSQVNPSEPKLDKFPSFKDAIKASVTFYIDPGEVLYIPPLWWHACESDCFNVGFNYWFYGNKQHSKTIMRLCTNYVRLIKSSDPATSIAERDKLYHLLLTGITSLENNRPINLGLKLSTKSAVAIHKIVKSFQDLYHCNPPNLAEYQTYKIFFCGMLRTFELTNTNQPYNAFPNVTYHQMRTNVIKKMGRKFSLVMKVKLKLHQFLRPLFSRRVL